MFSQSIEMVINCGRLVAIKKQPKILHFGNLDHIFILPKSNTFEYLSKKVTHCASIEIALLLDKNIWSLQPHNDIKVINKSNLNWSFFIFKCQKESVVNVMKFGKETKIVTSTSHTSSSSLPVFFFFTIFLASTVMQWTLGLSPIPRHTFHFTLFLFGSLVCTMRIDHLFYTWQCTSCRPQATAHCCCFFVFIAPGCHLNRWYVATFGSYFICSPHTRTQPLAHAGVTHHQQQHKIYTNKQGTT